MTVSEVIILFVAGVLAGALNSVAGGGSFISFPALASVGIPYINANTTNTLALWPGVVASVGAYRKELMENRARLPGLVVVSIIGGLIGAELLLGTTQSTFARILPFLLLFATLLFTFGRNATNAVRKNIESRNLPPYILTIIVLTLQTIVAIYGGFFGGGIGIMMLALLALLGMENIHEMNALKTTLSACINGIAVIAFVAAGSIYWSQAAVVMVGAIVGGYGGAYYARQIDPKLVRYFVIVVGFAITIWFFVKTYVTG